MKKVFLQFNKAFTLAEVLITLVIIGVIAALTIPNVINNTKKQEFVTGLKKSYSTLAQVTSQLIAENGSPINWSTSVDDIYNLYKPKLVNAKDCGSGSGCFEQTFQYLNGNVFNPGWNSMSHHRRLILGDGTQIVFGGAENDFSQTCTATGLAATNNICEMIFVDINGQKKPNQWGRDVFAFALTPDGLHPAGYEKVTDCTKSQNGYDCAAKVLRENAMNY